MMRLGELRHAMSETVAAVEPRLLSLDDAKPALADVTAMKNMMRALEGRLARRVADAAEWERAGFASPEAWLAAQTGTSPGQAKEALETARRLENQPDVADAVDRGELSAEQAAAVADAVEANPSAAPQLLEKAKALPLGKLRDECAKAKRAADPDPDATHARLHAARCLRFAKALDGAAKMFGASTPEQMAVIKAAVERRGNELFDQARRAGRREPREAYLMDALEQICREWLDGRMPTITAPATVARATDTAATVEDATSASEAAASPDVAGDDGDARDPTGVDETTADDDTGARVDGVRGDDAAGEPTTTPAPSSRTRGPAWLGLLRIDLEALLRGAVEGEELCEIAGLGPIPVSVARRLLGESVLKLVITRGVDVANVTHLGRGPTAAQRIALLWNNPGCSITGCGRRAGIQHDHVVDWTDTRHTVLAELQRLCTHHHDLKTRHRWAAIRGPDDAIVMVPPDDPRHPSRAGPDRDPPDAVPESEQADLFGDAAH